MFILSVKMAGAEGASTLYFDNESAAQKAADHLISNVDQHSVVWVTDARGHTMGCIPRNILFVVVADLARDIANQGDLQLIQARETAKLQTKAAADPALNFAQQMRGGPMGAFGRN